MERETSREVQAMFDEIVEELRAAGRIIACAKRFGTSSILVERQPIVRLSGNDMVFKLPDDEIRAALGIPGAHLFAPQGNGRRMRNWVQVPESQSSEWSRLAAAAERAAAT